MKKIIPFAIIVLIPFIFFWQFLIKGLLPIPSDTIVGLYHPFRGLYAKDYPRGIPFKNFLITDPVRQQYVWKNLSIDILKKGELPFWNPYSFGGNPHLANIQSAVFYPLNIFFLLPFHLGWTILIISQPLLAGLFTFLFLKNLKIDEKAAFLGSVIFSFGGFAIVWLEWGNILSTGLWLPLILLSIDRIFEHSNGISNSKYQIANIHIRNKKLLTWFLILLFASLASFFAGHLQTFFYLSILSFGYFTFRWFEHGRKLQALILFTI